jgi:hypothetical protein
MLPLLALNLPTLSLSNRRLPAGDEEPPVRGLADPDTPSFTFIDHNDNPQSRRIGDANARKAIRSHVMRDIRRREKLSGIKRPTKKGERNEACPTVSVPSVKLLNRNV